MHVVVVGAGPAGSVSALLLARSQIKTTIIDRAHFPRDKICAGALTPAASFALDEIGLLQECKEKAYPLNSTRYIGPDGRQIVVPHPSSGHMVLPRTEFDQLLLNQAIHAGATFEPGVHLTELARDSSGRVLGVRSKERVFHADLVVIASGANHHLIEREKRNSSTRHMCAMLRSSTPSPWSSSLAFYWHPKLLPYYTWVFPEGPDKMNLGCYMPSGMKRSDASSLLQDAWGKVHSGLSTIDYRPENLSVWPIPLSFSQKHLVGDGWCRVGDAAGLTHPVTGEGISQAIHSAILATGHITQLARQKRPATRTNLFPLEQQVRRCFLRQRLMGKACLKLIRSPLFNPLFSLQRFHPVRSISRSLSPL